MGLDQVRTKFDDWRSVTLSLYMGLVGYGVMVGIPVISTAWSENLDIQQSKWDVLQALTWADSH